MDFLVLCLAATCVLYVNGDKIKSKTVFYPSILDIACKQLILSSCPVHNSWINRCPEEINPKGSTETILDFPDGQEAIPTKAKSESADEGSRKSPSKIHPDPEIAHSGGPDLIQYNLNITLHQACEEGKLDVVKYILSKGMESINCRGKHKQTPVMTAARVGHVKVFEYLVSHGCDISAVNEYNRSVLHYACVGGSTEIVRTLIVKDRCDIESTENCGRTPIMYAAFSGHREVFDVLVEKGCDLLQIDKYKHNILHLACQGGHVDMVQHILSQTSVSMESRENTGKTPLLITASYGKAKVFDFLVRKGCKVNAVDNDKNNILHVACIAGRVDMVKHILSLNIVSIESRGFRGWTPLLTAAPYGKKRVFDFLVRKGCKVNAVDNDKNNILHVACIAGRVDMVKHILSLNIVSIESRGFRGWTPVLTAAQFGKKRVFDFLVRKGCKVNAVDNDKNNILHVACIAGRVDMVKHILSLNIVSIESRGFRGWTPVLTAAQYGKKRVFDFLVRKGCKVSAVDNQKNNILHLACKGGHVDMVQHILVLNTVSIESKGFKRRTPLLTAAKCREIRVFDVLVENGCKVSAVDGEKNNILHVACLGGHVEMVRHIISSKNVSGESKGFKGRTPVLIAARYSNTKVFDFLVRKGCKVMEVDNDKNNVLHLACMGGHVDMVRCILSLNIISIECRGTFGRVPLLFAAEFGNKRVFDFLIKKGCRITVVDDFRNNILHVACMGGHVDMVKYLLSLRVVDGMKKLRNKWGRTPLQVADRKSNKSLVNLLKNRK